MCSGSVLALALTLVKVPAQDLGNLRKKIKMLVKVVFLQRRVSSHGSIPARVNASTFYEYHSSSQEGLLRNVRSPLLGLNCACASPQVSNLCAMNVTADIFAPARDQPGE